MAKRNYLVEGLSGAGKSSVYQELIRRGYTAISTDRAWAYHADHTGLPGGPVHHDNWMWAQQKALSELESPEPEVLFVCGSSRNRDRLRPYFTKVVNLRIDDETMRRRLQERTDNDASSPRKSKSCSRSIGATKNRPERSMLTLPSLSTRWSTNCFA